MFKQTGKGGAGMQTHFVWRPSSSVGRMGSRHLQRLKWALENQELRIFSISLTPTSLLRFLPFYRVLYIVSSKCFLYLFYPPISLSFSLPSMTEPMSSLQEFSFETLPLTNLSAVLLLHLPRKETWLALWRLPLYHGLWAGTVLQGVIALVSHKLHHFPNCVTQSLGSIGNQRRKRTVKASWRIFNLD